MARPWLVRGGAATIVAIIVFFYVSAYQYQSSTNYTWPTPELGERDKIIENSMPYNFIEINKGDEDFISLERTSEAMHSSDKVLPTVEYENPEISFNSMGTTLSDKAFPCDDVTPTSFYGQKGKFWVLFNYIRATTQFKCDESVTYTTHSDFTYLENLTPLLERWQGPMSFSMYTPGTDFNETLARILYLRECSSPLVKTFVNFHLFFDEPHLPQSHIPADPMSIKINCTSTVKPKFGDGVKTFKKSKNLTYPVNVARNIARNSATTHYVLASDIELYPNPNLITNFLDMIRRNDTVLQRPKPKVFVLPIFEVASSVKTLPENKTQLVQMLRKSSAVLFHKYVCAWCHRVPKYEQWINAPIQQGMNVFHIGKRHKPHESWEPIFIGTKLDPIYDERLSWEGRRDKMTQGYILCVLDYEFHILDNAFLVHKPGIKRPSKATTSQLIKDSSRRQSSFIAKVISRELKILYDSKSECVL